MKKKILFVMLTAILLTALFSLSLSAEDVYYVEDDYEYTVAAGSAVITGYSGNEENIVIPDTLGSYPVIEIGIDAFLYNLEAKAITVPEGVKTIGQGAFSQCENLKSLSLPSTLSSIDDYITEYCYALEEITVASANTSFCSVDNVLFSKDMSILYRYAPAKADTAYTVPKEVRIIEKGAFEETSLLTAVTLPEGLEAISDYAFYYSTLKEIDLPASIVYLGSGIFSSCDTLEAVNVAKENPVFASYKGVLFTADMKTLLLYPVSKPDTTYSVPPTVKEIGQDAMINLKYLSELIVQEGVENIAEYAFYGSNIAKLTLPSTAAFDTYLFEALPCLEEININEGHPVYASKDGVLFSAAMDILYIYPSARTQETYTVPETVTYINDYAFRTASALTKIELPEGLKTIGMCAFADCSVTEIDIPASVNEITDDAFFGASALKAINVSGDNKTYYSKDGVLFKDDMIVFYPENKPGTVYTIPENVQSVGYSVFYYCNNLNAVIVHKNVNTIGENSFAGENLAVFGYEGSYMEEYAHLNDIYFFPMSYMNKFEDVKAGSWYTAGVLCASNMELMKGVGNNLFNPTGVLTREQFVQILFNFENINAKDYQGETGFKDVPQGKWYSAAVKWAKEAGVSDGIGQGKFGLGDSITREQLAKFIFNYATKINIDTNSYGFDIGIYDDSNKVAKWAYEAMTWSVSVGLFTSTSNVDLVLDPRAVVIRAVAAKVMVSFEEYLLFA